MPNPFKALERETLKLIKEDGTVVDDLRTSGIDKKGQVIFFREDVAFDIGDLLERHVPPGRTETYHVDDVSFQPGLHSIPNHFILTVSNVAKPKKLPIPHTVTYNLYGPNSRVNNHSTDHSQNVVGIDADDLFKKVEEVLTGAVRDQQELQDLRHQLAEMHATQGQPKFTASYVRFMEIAADHMTVLTPFLPALAQLLVFAGTPK